MKKKIVIVFSVIIIMLLACMLFMRDVLSVSGIFVRNTDGRSYILLCDVETRPFEPQVLRGGIVDGRKFLKMNEIDGCDVIELSDDVYNLDTCVTGDRVVLGKEVSSVPRIFDNICSWCVDGFLECVYYFNPGHRPTVMGFDLVGSTSSISHYVIPVMTDGYVVKTGERLDNIEFDVLENYSLSFFKSLYDVSSNRWYRELIF